MFSFISKKYLKENLTKTPYVLNVKNTVTSTNTLMKEGLQKKNINYNVLIATGQTAGRGRMGRSFYSPSGSGIYMSIAYKISGDENPLHITTDAAVCLARVLENMSGKNALIKWVNDIYIDGRKVCGILTEKVGEYAVLGIGINVLHPKKGFPDDIKDRAGAVFSEKRPHLKEDLIVSILKELQYVRENKDRARLLFEYRERSMIIGKEITILGTDEKATALSIDDDYSLVVKKENGETVKLSSGDVSIKI